MKVLVTGGAGFIGSNLVKELLLDHGTSVRVLDDLSTGSMSNLEEVITKIEFVKGSITDINTVNTACSGIDVVFHLAAKISVEESILNPELTNTVNVGGTLNVLSAAKKNNVKKFIFSSSAAVYGSVESVPVTENSAVSPESPYAVQKYFGEKYCEYFAKHHGISTVCLRYFNVYGPYQQESGGYAGVIYKFIKNALLNRSIVIEGDGKQTRDFVFIKDIVNANILAYKATEMSFGNVYNVGTGKETSILDLYNAIKQIAGHKAPVAHSEKRIGDIYRSCANIELSKKHLGYQPTTSLQEGLDRTINWVKNKI